MLILPFGQKCFSSRGGTEIDDWNGILISRSSLDKLLGWETVRQQRKIGFCIKVACTACVKLLGWGLGWIGFAETLGFQGEGQEGLHRKACGYEWIFIIIYLLLAEYPC